MTRLDKIKTMTEEEAGRYLCDEIDKLSDVYMCDICPWTKMCKAYHNGITEWLKEEAEEE